MAAGVSLNLSKLKESSVSGTFDDVLPTKMVLLSEARKFLAFKMILSWRTFKSDPSCTFKSVDLKSLAQLVYCRQEKLADFSNDAMFLLFDALSEMFVECVETVESDFFVDGFGFPVVKTEADLAPSFDHRDLDHSLESNESFTCKFCSAHFGDAESLFRHIDSMCYLNPFPNVSEVALKDVRLEIADLPIVQDAHAERQENARNRSRNGTSATNQSKKHNCNSESSDLSNGPSTRARTRNIIGKKKISKRPVVGVKNKSRPGRGVRTVNRNQTSNVIIRPEEDQNGGGLKAEEEEEKEDELTMLSCRICGEMFPDKAKLHKHIWKHNRKRNHICDICGKGFWMKYLLNEHRNTHTGEKPYVCSICGESFCQLQGFNAHKRAHRFESKLKNNEAKGVGDDSTKDSETEEAFEMEAVNDKIAEITPSLQNSQPSLNCRHCGRVCKTIRTLTNHESIHTSGISKNSYKYFMEVKEKEFDGVKEHACEICGEKFGFRNSLSYHRRKCHRMFICVQCGKSYNCSQALNNHLRAHTGEKKFECYVCEKKYLHQAGLVKHMEVHEGKTFSCEICNRTFTRAAYLKKHQVMHGDQDKYAEVKSKRAASCRRQRSGMTEDKKEEYKRERREYMRDWLAKKRRAMTTHLEPVVSCAISDLTADSRASVFPQTTDASAKASATAEMPVAEMPSTGGFESWQASGISVAPADGATASDRFVAVTEAAQASNSNPTIFTPATTAMPMSSASIAHAIVPAIMTSSTPSSHTIMPISSLMKTISTPGLASSTTQETIFIDPATMASIVGGGDGQSESLGGLKPLTLTLPSNLVEAPSIGPNELKPLTLTLPSNIAASLGITAGLQTTNLNHLQIPANVLPVALADGTVANVPVSMANALFSCSNFSTSLPPL